MRAPIVRVLMLAAIAIATSWPVCARDATFGDLLARAQAQAASGHRWSPPGDNMTETVAVMLDIISTATAQQLADLSDLLEKNASNPPPSQITPAASAPVPAAPPTVAPPQAPAAPVETQASLMPAQRPAATETTASGNPVARRIRTEQRPTPRALELYARGQEAERQGNVSGARRFFASAADQGSSAAARSLGRLYDPAYLKQTALGGIDPDPALARSWYERAVAMGDAQAGSLLEALAVR
jgi:TPR repeat protein